ncbi:DUF1003 domain-containing protein [Sphingomonas sp. TDK1]|uniref:DUF1003 domain-containing protein n=1 Tax=Sphingomonas sp. TDK1 TaxID=453247 RepID=UPI0007DA1CCF|nr:DUF1003 domain-containing protein [Sphingomonas sp. TDK1]OAN66908.1 hypothetical protein A7X12_09825 [Sphingomonas sp. TDK1]
MNAAIRFLNDLRRMGGGARDLNTVFDERLTFGERLADRVAAVGGSWGFIIGFGVFLGAWALINTVVLAAHAFDPFPFIFLNLMLSMLAALQAPIIMMSQNRQAAKDRLEARLDYETNLRAEAQIEELHAKIDSLHADIARLMDVRAPR